MAYQKQNSILAHVTASDVVMEPFPHIVVKNCLPQTLYDELDRTYPNMASFADKNGLVNNRAYNKAARVVLSDTSISQAWHNFVADHTSREFLLDLWAIFSEALDRHYPALNEAFSRESGPSDIGLRGRAKEHLRNNQHSYVMDCQISINSPVTKMSSVRGCHIDSPYELIGGLLYLRRDDDHSHGGNLELHRYRDPAKGSFTPDLQIAHKFTEKVIEVPYQANTLVLFLNSVASLHAVSPRSVTSVPRRLVNFLVERYTEPKGLFTVPMRKYPLHQRVLARIKRSLRLKN